MILQHKKISLGDKVVFESILADSPQSFSYPLQDEACFIHVKQGSQVAFTPDEIVEISEGNLAFANSGNIIFKTEPNEESGLFQATIIHISKELVLETFASKFPAINKTDKPRYSQDMVTGKPCVIINNYITGVRYLFPLPNTN